MDEASTSNQEAICLTPIKIKRPYSKKQPIKADGKMKRASPSPTKTSPSPSKKNVSKNVDEYVNYSSASDGFPTPKKETSQMKKYFNFILQNNQIIMKKQTKMYACDICTATYRHVFSLKRHFLRNHVTVKYISKSDINNCKIISHGDPDDFSTLHDSDESSMSSHMSENKKKNLSNEIGVDCDINSGMEGLYRCHLCADITFSNKPELQSHYSTHPNTSKVRFPCSKCGSVFSHKQTLLRHITAHANSSTLICKVCGKNFGTKASYIKHSKAHGDNRKCKYCSKILSTTANKRRHERIHEGLKPYPCKRCDSQFSQSSDLKKHLKQQHGVSYFSCNFCRAVFASRVTLSKHLTDAHSLNAEQNFNKVTSPQKENSHLPKLVNKEQTNETVQSHNKSFNCTVCKRTYPTYLIMLRHRRQCHSYFHRRNVPKRVRNLETSIQRIHRKRNNRWAESEYYNSVSLEIADNLLNHVDGKTTQLSSRQYNFTDQLELSARIPTLSWSSYNFPADFDVSQVSSTKDLENKSRPYETFLPFTDHFASNGFEVFNCDSSGAYDFSCRCDSESDVSDTENPFSPNCLADTNKTKTIVIGRDAPSICMCCVCKEKFTSHDAFDVHCINNHPSVLCTCIEVESEDDLPPPLPEDLSPVGVYFAYNVPPPISEKPNITCTKCKSSFSSAPDLHQHIISCSGIKPTEKHVRKFLSEKKIKLTMKSRMNTSLKPKFGRAVMHTESYLSSRKIASNEDMHSKMYKNLMDFRPKATVGRPRINLCINCPHCSQTFRTKTLLNAHITRCYKRKAYKSGKIRKASVYSGNKSLKEKSPLKNKTNQVNSVEKHISNREQKTIDISPITAVTKSADQSLSTQSLNFNKSSIVTSEKTPNISKPKTIELVNVSILVKPISIDKVPSKNVILTTGNTCNLSTLFAQAEGNISKSKKMPQLKTTATLPLNKSSPTKGPETPTNKEKVKDLKNVSPAKKTEIKNASDLPIPIALEKTPLKSPKTVPKKKTSPNKIQRSPHKVVEIQTKHEKEDNTSALSSRSPKKLLKFKESLSDSLNTAQLNQSEVNEAKIDSASLPPSSSKEIISPGKTARELKVTDNSKSEVMPLKSLDEKCKKTKNNTINEIAEKLATSHEKQASKDATNLTKLPLEKQVSKDATTLTKLPLEKQASKDATNLTKLPLEKQGSKDATNLTKLPLEKQASKDATNLTKLPIEKQASKGATNLTKLPLEKQITNVVANLTKVLIPRSPASQDNALDPQNSTSILCQEKILKLKQKLLTPKPKLLDATEPANQELSNSNKAKKEASIEISNIADKSMDNKIESKAVAKLLSDLTVKKNSPTEDISKIKVIKSKKSPKVTIVNNALTCSFSNAGNSVAIKATASPKKVVKRLELDSPTPSLHSSISIAKDSSVNSLKTIEKIVNEKEPPVPFSTTAPYLIVKQTVSNVMENSDASSNHLSANSSSTSLKENGLDVTECNVALASGQSALISEHLRLNETLNITAIDSGIILESKISSPRERLSPSLEILINSINEKLTSDELSPSHPTFSWMEDEHTFIPSAQFPHQSPVPIKTKKTACHCFEQRNSTLMEDNDIVAEVINDLTNKVEYLITQGFASPAVMLPDHSALICTCTHTDSSIDNSNDEKTLKEFIVQSGPTLHLSGVTLENCSRDSSTTPFRKIDSAIKEFNIDKSKLLSKKPVSLRSYRRKPKPFTSSSFNAQSLSQEIPSANNLAAGKSEKKMTTHRCSHCMLEFDYFLNFRRHANSCRQKRLRKAKQESLLKSTCVMHLPKKDVVEESMLNLLRHQTRQSEIMKEVKTDENDDGKRLITYTCNICNKIFFSLFKLCQHRVVHKLKTADDQGANADNSSFERSSSDSHLEQSQVTRTKVKTGNLVSKQSDVSVEISDLIEVMLSKIISHTAPESVLSSTCQSDYVTSKKPKSPCKNFIKKGNDQNHQEIPMLQLKTINTLSEVKKQEIEENNNNTNPVSENTNVFDIQPDTLTSTINARLIEGGKNTDISQHNDLSKPKTFIPAAENDISRNKCIFRVKGVRFRRRRWKRKNWIVRKKHVGINKQPGIFSAEDDKKFEEIHSNVPDSETVAGQNSIQSKQEPCSDTNVSKENSTLPVMQSKVKVKRKYTKKINILKADIPLKISVQDSVDSETSGVPKKRKYKKKMIQGTPGILETSQITLEDNTTSISEEKDIINASPEVSTTANAVQMSNVSLENLTLKKCPSGDSSDSKPQKRKYKKKMSQVNAHLSDVSDVLNVKIQNAALDCDAGSKILVPLKRKYTRKLPQATSLPLEINTTVSSDCLNEMNISDNQTSTQSSSLNNTVNLKLPGVQKRKYTRKIFKNSSDVKSPKFLNYINSTKKLSNVAKPLLPQRKFKNKLLQHNSQYVKTTVNPTTFSDTKILDATSTEVSTLQYFTDARAFLQQKRKYKRKLVRPQFKLPESSKQNISQIQSFDVYDINFSEAVLNKDALPQESTSDGLANTLPLFPQKRKYTKKKKISDVHGVDLPESPTQSSIIHKTDMEAATNSIPVLKQKRKYTKKILNTKNLITVDTNQSESACSKLSDTIISLEGTIVTSVTKNVDKNSILHEKSPVTTKRKYTRKTLLPEHALKKMNEIDPTEAYPKSSDVVNFSDTNNELQKQSTNGSMVIKSEVCDIEDFKPFVVKKRKYKRKILPLLTDIDNPGSSTSDVLSTSKITQTSDEGFIQNLDMSAASLTLSSTPKKRKYKRKILHAPFISETIEAVISAANTASEVTSTLGESSETLETTVIDSKLTKSQPSAKKIYHKKLSNNKSQELMMNSTKNIRLQKRKYRRTVLSNGSNVTNRTEIISSSDMSKQNISQLSNAQVDDNFKIDNLSESLPKKRKYKKKGLQENISIIETKQEICDVLETKNALEVTSALIDNPIVKTPSKNIKIQVLQKRKFCKKNFQKQFLMPKSRFKGQHKVISSLPSVNIVPKKMRKKRRFKFVLRKRQGIKVSEVIKKAEFPLSSCPTSDVELSEEISKPKKRGRKKKLSLTSPDGSASTLKEHTSSLLADTKEDIDVKSDIDPIWKDDDDIAASTGHRDELSSRYGTIPDIKDESTSEISENLEIDRPMNSNIKSPLVKFRASVSDRKCPYCKKLFYSLNFKQRHIETKHKGQHVVPKVKKIIEKRKTLLIKKKRRAFKRQCKKNSKKS